VEISIETKIGKLEIGAKIQMKPTVSSQEHLSRHISSCVVIALYYGMRRDVSSNTWMNANSYLWPISLFRVWRRPGKTRFLFCFLFDWKENSFFFHVPRFQKGWQEAGWKNGVTSPIYILYIRNIRRNKQWKPTRSERMATNHSHGVSDFNCLYRKREQEMTSRVYRRTNHQAWQVQAVTMWMS
jgi:hypothetical protein